MPANVEVGRDNAAAERVNRSFIVICKPAFLFLLNDSSSLTYIHEVRTALVMRLRISGDNMNEHSALVILEPAHTCAYRVDFLPNVTALECVLHHFCATNRSRAVSSNGYWKRMMEIPIPYSTECYRWHQCLSRHAQKPVRSLGRQCATRSSHAPCRDGHSYLCEV